MVKSEIKYMDLNSTGKETPSRYCTGMSDRGWMNWSFITLSLLVMKYSIWNDRDFSRSQGHLINMEDIYFWESEQLKYLTFCITHAQHG